MRRALTCQSAWSSVCRDCCSTWEYSWHRCSLYGMRLGRDLDLLHRAVFVGVLAAWVFVLVDGVVAEITLNFFVLYVCSGSQDPR